MTNSEYNDIARRLGVLEEGQTKIEERLRTQEQRSIRQDTLQEGIDLRLSKIEGGQKWLLRLISSVLITVLVTEIGLRIIPALVP